MNVRCQARENVCTFLEHGFQKSAQDSGEVPRRCSCNSGMSPRAGAPPGRALLQAERDPPFQPTTTNMAILMGSLQSDSASLDPTARYSACTGFTPNSSDLQGVVSEGSSVVRVASILRDGYLVPDVEILLSDVSHGVAVLPLQTDGRNV
jgi:hypothetical protein